jgi:hypothetical protein
MSLFSDFWDAITSIPGVVVGALEDPVGTVEDIVAAVAGEGREIVMQVWNALESHPGCLMCIGSPSYWQTVSEIRAAQRAGVITNQDECQRTRERVTELFPVLAAVPGLPQFWDCACRVALSDQVTNKAIVEATAISHAAFALSAEDQLTGVVSAASWGAARLDLLVRGKGNGVWHKCYNRDSGWYPAKDWSSLGGQIQQPPAIVSWGPNRLDIFVCGGDRCLWHKCYDGAQGWYPSPRDWNSLGGQILGGPSAASWGPGTLHLVVRGTDSATYYKGFNQNKWTPWVSLGGQITDAPRVVSWGPGRLDIFARGPNGRCYHRAYDASWKHGWAGWEDLGGSIVGSPSVVSWGRDRLDIVVRGTDGGIWHKCWNPAGGYYPSLTEWTPLRGSTTGTPGIISWGSGRLDIVARAPSGGIMHKCYSQADGWYPGQSKPWSQLGGKTSGLPTTISWGTGHLAILARSTEGTVLYRDFHAGKGWMKEWADLGGQII